MRLKINLATRRYLNLRQLNLALLVVGGALAALLAFNLQRAAFNAGDLARVKREEAAAQARSGQGEVVSDAKLKALAKEVRFANETIERKSLNWVNLLDSLEEVVPDGVALVQISPDPHKQILNVTGVARSFANLRSFLENLEQSRHFSEVYLLTQEERKVGLTQQGIGFNVSCKVDLR